nr:hypothetical protein [Actinomarinicola tropica]
MPVDAESADGVGLAVRQEVVSVVVDADGSRDPAGAGDAVAGEEPGLTHPSIDETRDGATGFDADLVVKRESGAERAVDLDADDGVGVAGIEVTEECRASDPDPSAVHSGLYAARGNQLDVGRFGERNASFGGGGDDGLADGVFTPAFSRRCEAEQRVLVELVGCAGAAGNEGDVDHLGGADGDGAGLVERGEVDGGQPFEDRAATDEDAVSGGGGERGERGGHGGEHHGARGCHDEEGHDPHHRVLGGPPPPPRPHDDEEHGGRDDTDRVALLESLDEQLCGRLLFDGLVHCGGKARQGAVGGHLGRLHDQGTFGDRRPGEDRPARNLANRERFVRERGLVDSCLPVNHDPVARNAGTWSDEDPVADQQVVRRDVSRPAIRFESLSRLGGVDQQSPHARCSALGRRLFECPGGREDEDQQRTISPLTEHRCRDRGHDHQQVDIETPSHDLSQRA